MIAPQYIPSNTPYKLPEDAVLIGLFTMGNSGSAWGLGVGGVDASSAPVVRVGAAGAGMLYIPLQIKLQKGQKLYASSANFMVYFK